jgi:hypothetical protein
MVDDRMSRIECGLALGLGLFVACDGGLFGSDEVEDHRFLVDLRNVSLAPVTIKLANEPEGFVIQGVSVTTIQRSATPGAELAFEAIVGEDFLAQTVSCRYTPPSDTSPRRRVSWNGADLLCLNWD